MWPAQGSYLHVPQRAVCTTSLDRLPDELDKLAPHASEEPKRSQILVFTSSSARCISSDVEAPSDRDVE